MIAPIVLAAGRSTRFKDPKTKLLHELEGITILKRVLKNLENAGFRNINVVVGHQRFEVMEQVTGLYESYNFIIQDEQKGTGHAVKCCHNYVHADDILVVFGDKPLFRPQTIKGFVDSHKNMVTVATIEHPVPENYSEGYGTVIRECGEIKALKKIPNTFECDAALYLFNANWLWNNIDRLQEHDGQFFLPDMVEIASRSGIYVGEFKVKNYREAIGINTKKQFEEAQSYLK